MKKYFLGFSAIALAIVFSAFSNEKFLLDRTFMLTASPTSSGVVSTNTNWKTAAVGGQLYGVCTPSTPDDLACRIKVKVSTTGAYFHQVTLGSDVGYVLNDASYASDQVNHPGAKFFTITEADGKLDGGIQYKIIDDIVPSGAGLTKGTDYDLDNAKLN